MKFEQKDKIFTIGLFLTAILIRLFFLFKPKDIWHDEAFSILYTQKPILFMLAGNDVHFPFYYFFLKIIMFFTMNELILRSFSLLCFIGFFIMLHLLLKKQCDYGTRWFTLIMITLSPTFIFYSLEIRNYMLGMFLVVAQIYFFFKCLSNLDKKRNFYLYILFSVLMLYTHYYTCFVLLIEGLYLLKHFSYKYHNHIYYSPRIIFFFKPFIIISIFSIPLIIYFLVTLTKMQSMWFKDVNFISFISTTTYQFIFPTMFESNTIYLFLIMFVSLIIIYFYFKMLPLTKFYLSLFYIPVILLWLISQFTPIYHHRFFLFYSFGLYIIIGKGISYLYNSKWKWGIYVGAILFALFLQIIFGGISLYDSVQDKELYKSQLVLKDYLNENEQYIFIHESTFSISPMKVYFQDYDNVKHYLINNLTRKQLFTAGGSVVEDWEIINNSVLEIMISNNNNEIIYFVHNMSVYGKGFNVIYNNGGLLIYD